MRIRLTKKSSLIGIFLLIIGGGLFYWQTAQGVNRTWDGGGTDGTCGGGAGDGNKWSCAANWSGDVAPGASDIAVFDTTSTKDVTIASNISVAGISINAGYTGTITQTSTFTVTVGSSHYSQAAGTFTGGSGTIDINGTFTLSGGTFTSTSGTLEVGRGFIETVFSVIIGATFTHNSGTVKFVGAFSTVNSDETIDVDTTITFYNVVIGNGSDDDDIIVASGDTIVVANDLTHIDNELQSGSWEVHGNIIIGSTAEGGAATVTYTTTGAHTYAYTAGGIGPHIRVNHASATISAAVGTTDLKVSLFSLLNGSFTAPSGVLEVGRNIQETIFTISSGTTFTHSNGTVKFVGGLANTTTETIDVDTTLTLYNVTIGNSGDTADTITTAAGDTIIVANNFVHTSCGLAGTWEVQGNYTVATTAGGGTAGITFTGGNNQTYTDQGGDEPNGDVLINKSGGTVTLASGADWNATNQDLTITAGTLDASTYNITTVNFTVNGGTFTGGSGTVTTSGPFNMSSGTFTGGNGTIDINNTFTLSNGTFTSTSGTLEVGYSSSTLNQVTITSTFNHNNGTVKFVPGGDVSPRTYTVDVNTTLTLYNIEWDSISSLSLDTLTPGSGDIIIAANDFIHTDGRLGGTWEVQGNVIIGSSADGGAGTLTMTGTGSKTYTYSAGGSGPHLRINNALLSVSANTGTTSLKVALFSLIDGSFTAPAGTFEVGRGSSSETIFTQTGGIFVHNNGSVKFTPSGDITAYTYTVDVPSSITLYNVEYASQNTLNADFLTTAAGDTIIVSNNFTHTNGRLNGAWEVQGNYTVATTADGGTAGITFTGGNNQTYTDQGGNEVDGDVLINKSGNAVTLASGADWNATNQDLTITAGTLGSSTFNITTVNFTVNGGTFTGGSGTVTTSGPMVVSSGTFTGGAGNVTVTAASGLTLSGGAFTASSGTLSVATFTHTAGGTFTHNNGVVLVTANTGVIDVATSETFYDLTFNNNFFGTVSSGDTVIVTGVFTLTNGTVDTGTIEARGDVVIGSGADGGTGTLSFLVSGDQTITGNGGTVCNLNINKSSGTLSAGSTNLSSANFTLSGGIFTSTSGTLFVNTFTHTSGGTFSHNNGTVTFGGFHTTLDVTSSETFYNLTLNKSNGYQLALSNDTVIVLGTLTQTEGAFMSGVLELQGNVIVASTADGGTATINFTGGNNQVYTDQGGNEPDGDVTINKTPGSSVTLASNADWNAASQDLTITSGELNMGASYNLSTTALTVATNGHLSNYGTGDLTLAGNVSNSGNIRFRSSGTCGGSDSISIASSSAGVQRSWSGSGTYLFHDVTVQDQGGSAALTLYSSTSVSGNGVNWTFSGAACPAVPPATGLSTGKINVTTGKLNLR